MKLNVRIVANLILVLLIIGVACVWAENPRRSEFKSLDRTELNILATLQTGYYISTKFVNTKKKTYSTTKAFDLAPIYGEFEVQRENGKIKFLGGNFHEGLVEFRINDNGTAQGDLCFDRFCITELKVIDDRTFSIKVNDNRQTFISVKGLKEINRK